MKPTNQARAKKIIKEIHLDPKDKYAIWLEEMIVEALEAKDEEAKLEQRNLIHRVPIELSYAGMIQWKEDEIEKLNQLKDDSN